MCNSGLPVLRLLPDAPVPDGRTVLTTPDNNHSLEAIMGHGEHPPPFIRDTNAIESVHARLRRSVRARGHFPTEQAAMKCLYLAVRSLDPTGRGQQRWSNRWKPALNAFAITFEGRIEHAVN
jgi:transposase-like protein